MSEQVIKQLQDNLKGCQAQLEAAKQMFNEQLNSNMQLRSNLVLMQQQIKEDAAEKERLDNNIKKLTQKILELSPPKEGELEYAANPQPE